MTNDDRFIKQNRDKIINFKVGSSKKGLSAGKYLVIIKHELQYYIYAKNDPRNLRNRIIDTPFKSIIDAYKFAIWMHRHYGELMHLMISEWNTSFFRMTQYTVDHGESIYRWVAAKETLDQPILSSDLAWIRS